MVWMQASTMFERDGDLVVMDDIICLCDRDRAGWRCMISLYDSGMRYGMEWSGAVSSLTMI